MNVCHFIQRYPPALGGSEAYFRRLSDYLASRGHHVTVWTTSALDLEAFWSPRGRLLPSGVDTSGSVTVRRYAPARWPLRRYLLKALSFFPHSTWQAMTMPCNPVSIPMWRDAGADSIPVDIVHATAFPYAWPIRCAIRLARRRGVPFVLTPFLHLGAPDRAADRTRRQYLSRPLRAILHEADRIFVQTPGEWSAIRDLGIPEARLILQGMGVEAAECVSGEPMAARVRFRVQHDLATDMPVIGHLANLSIEKGTVDLLQAAARLWERGEEFQIVLVGPNMPNFRRFWERFSWQKNVRLVGVVSDEEKRGFFSGIDLFVLPSRSDSFGLVLLEAWANGLANIAYRAGGIADVIRSGQDGLLTTCGDLEELAAAIQRLLGNPDLRKQYGAVGRLRTKSEFQWDQKLGLVEATYRQIQHSRCI